VKRQGYEFVVRYLSHDVEPRGKVVTPVEVAAIGAAGLDLCLVWEFAATDALGGYRAGVLHATEAGRQAHALGAPADQVIYFAVDFDATPAQLAVVRDYFRGVQEILPYSRIGAYGGIKTVSYLDTHQCAKWLWQTYAWSYGQWYGAAHVRQIANGQQVAGADVDINVTTSDFIGQWRIGGASTPGEGDMDKSQATSFWFAIWRQLGIQTMQDPIIIPAAPDYGVPEEHREPNLLAQAIRDLEARPAIVTLDDADRAAVASMVTDQLKPLLGLPLILADALECAADRLTRAPGQ